MQNITYTSTQINDIVQLLNTITLSGIDNCNKISTIYQILNNNVKVNSNSGLDKNVKVNEESK